MTIRTLVLTGFGINCEHETAHAFALAGAEPTLVHLNDLIADPTPLDTHDILAIPGGFSFGDDVASGRILANRLRYTLGDPLRRFVAAGKLAIGICNGFQVMVKMGLLPMSDGRGESGDSPALTKPRLGQPPLSEGSETGLSPFSHTRDNSQGDGDSPALAEPRLGQSLFSQEVTLTHNNSSRFEDRWVTLEVDPATPCVWLKGMTRFEVPIRHGEGKFIPRDDALLDRLAAQGQLAVRYALPGGGPANGAYPANPNGSVGDVAGLCDPTGRIFGLMPHPEAYVARHHHPRWTREELPEEGAGLQVFRNAVAYAQEHLRS